MSAAYHGETTRRLPVRVNHWLRSPRIAAVCEWPTNSLIYQVKTDCQLHINATGVVITGPRGAQIRNLNWDQLVELAQG
jgi:hypothetical protein